MFAKFKCFSKELLKILCVVNYRNHIIYCPMSTSQKIIDKFIFVNIFVRNFLSKQIRKNHKTKIPKQTIDCMQQNHSWEA